MRPLTFKLIRTKRNFHFLSHGVPHQRAAATCGERLPPRDRLAQLCPSLQGVPPLHGAHTTDCLLSRLGEARFSFSVQGFHSNAPPFEEAPHPGVTVAHHTRPLGGPARHLFALLHEPRPPQPTASFTQLSNALPPTAGTEAGGGWVPGSHRLASPPPKAPLHKQQLPCCMRMGEKCA